MESNQRDSLTEPGRMSVEPGTTGVSAQSIGAEPAGLELGSLTTPSIHEPWFVSLKNQVGELLSKQEPLPKYRGAPIRRGDEEARLALLNLRVLHEPWFVSLKRQYKAFQAEKKLPPLKVSSKPVRVKSIWGAYDHKQEGVRYFSGGACSRGRSRLSHFLRRSASHVAGEVDRLGSGFRHLSLYGRPDEGSARQKERRRWGRRHEFPFAAEQRQAAEVFDAAVGLRRRR